MQIGDHAINDVAGAIRAGLGGVYYNPRGLSVDEAFANLDLYSNTDNSLLPLILPATFRLEL